MDLALTCMLCLAGAVPSGSPATTAALDGSPALSLALPRDLRLSNPGDPGTFHALAQHEHGAQDGHGSHEEHGEGDSQGHGGHGDWMGTAMIVVMVAMMATVGVFMMTRGGFRSAPLSGPAAAALPAIPAASYSVPGG